MENHNKRHKAVCVCIPVYRPWATVPVIERVNLAHTLDILSARDIYYIAPETLDQAGYPEGPGTVTFGADCFTGQASYSRLLTSHGFYGKFIDLGYDMTLICQPDVWVFRDSLDEWTDAGYDYVGAPIFTNWYIWDRARTEGPQTGNGGFSLRDLHTLHDVLDPEGMIYKEAGLGPLLKGVIFEDHFICDTLRDRVWLKIPGWRKALDFSWDMNPETAYEAAGGVLPMAAHATGKNIRFWKDFIPEYTPDIQAWCEEEYRELFRTYYKTDERH